MSLFPAWWIIRTALGDVLAPTHPEAALSIAPHDRDALLAAADVDFSAVPPRASIAARRLREALAGNPADARIYAGLGLAASLQDDGHAADRIFSTALRRSRREAAPDVWAFDRAMAAGDYVEACEALDFTLRTQPSSLLTVMAEKVALLAATPAALAPLRRLLATGPLWRAGLLQAMAGSPSTLDTVEPLLDALNGAAHPPTESEVASFLVAAIARGDYRRAEAAWRRLSPSGRIAPPGLLNNGRFRIDVSRTPFGWTAAADAAGTASLGGRPDGAGLRVILTDRAAPAPLISQLLVAPAGRYVLSGGVRASDQQAPVDIGLTWILVCAGTGQRLGETPVIGGEDRWRRITVAFTVPDRQCDAQWLELHRRGSLTGLADGAEVWFDDFSLTSIGARPGS